MTIYAGFERFRYGAQTAAAKAKKTIRTKIFFLITQSYGFKKLKMILFSKIKSLSQNLAPI